MASSAPTTPPGIRSTVGTALATTASVGEVCRRAAVGLARRQLEPT